MADNFSRAGKGARKRLHEVPEGPGQNEQVDRLKAEVKRLKAAAAKVSEKGGQKGKKGEKGKKGKRAPRNETTLMPRELIGCVASFEGKPLCFDFNMNKGCSLTVDANGRCKKGFHLCARKGCGGARSASVCTRT